MLVSGIWSQGLPEDQITEGTEAHKGWEASETLVTPVNSDRAHGLERARSCAGHFLELPNNIFRDVARQRLVL
jgi:hypothetical protein